MAGVRLEFAQFGHFDYFNIYRNSAPTAIENLGEPIGSSSTMYYEDLTVESNQDYYYRAGVVRNSIEEFSGEFHVKTVVEFDPPYNLIVEFKNDETNRLELNWSLDGFVDEQRYYCSETPIDIENLPEPKAVLAGDVRTYIDTDITVSKIYYVRVGSVRNGVEKLSSEFNVSTGDLFFDDVDLLFIADTVENSYIDHSKNSRAVTIGGSLSIESLSGKSCIKFSGSNSNTGNTTNGRIITGITPFGLTDYTLETWCAYRPDSQGGARIFEIGTSDSNRSTILPKASSFNGSLYLNNVDRGAITDNYFDSVLRHHCIMRRNGITAYYVDGVKKVETTNSINMLESRIVLGTAWSSNGPFQGYIQSLRVTKTARYAQAGFIPDSNFEKF